MLEGLPRELTAAVLRQPVLHGARGILRQVCREWRDILRHPDDVQTEKQEVVRTISLLAWARDNGLPWDESTCSFAAFGGHLAVLQWARDKGCPWDEETCSYAAAGGHLAVLQWARDNGCPWDE